MSVPVSISILCICICYEKKDDFETNVMNLCLYPPCLNITSLIRKQLCNVMMSEYQIHIYSKLIRI